ncbi:MAG: excinuclease ABC subunit UvrA [Candidatus Calescibacterium sp.]|nr:excinuclease ABC subunit UvrA [Candidatus Calescibacterium sp.]MDW8087403.1 excinuclease ABC subunit UvrA [Candidatus Calescibacterium sp.]
MASDFIYVKGARQHNLKNIDVKIPKNKFVVVSGVSGSGKSSLVFDILFAEGQRRYVECLSSYARQFIEQMPKPDVDSVEGLSPAIAIDQKSARWNPRSTVATSTEIYDYLRLLFARVGDPFCPNCSIPISAMTPQRIAEIIMDHPEGTKIFIFSPYVRGKKGEYRKELEIWKSRGFSRVRIDGELYDLFEATPQLDKNKKHTIEILVDRLVLRKDDDTRRRITSSVEQAKDISKGLVLMEEELPDGRKNTRTFSTVFSCPECSFSFEEISPRIFSFNSPYGACPTCHGIGKILKVDEELVIDQEKSIQDGAIRAYKNNFPDYIIDLLEEVGKLYKKDIFREKWKNLPEKVKRAILYAEGLEGFDEGGLIDYLWGRYEEGYYWEVERYISSFVCQDCGGSRLKRESLSVYVGGKNIHQLASMTVEDLYDFLKNLKFEGEKKEIAQRIFSELMSRLEFIKDVGLGYLELSRESSSLSSGESQRLKLAAQLGAKLSGVLYVLDEPTCGLHPRDIDRLMMTLKKLRDIGNTVVVVEHDRDAIENADLIIDLGKGGGVYGGNIVFYGTPEEAKNNGNSNSFTCQYLSGKRDIVVPSKRREPDGRWIILRGAKGRNLKNITVKFPVGLFTCVTGVSGSGKSTLVVDTLYPAVKRFIEGDSREKPLEFDSIEGVQSIDKVILVDQSPIGRTPRSNPATYTGIFTPIRELFASLPESRARGYTISRFSFNVPGGRCEECRGEGFIKVEMQLLPDMYITCKACNGKRFNRDTLEVRFKGKNIAEILDMTVDESLEFFANQAFIRDKIQVLKDVGLGYIKLGQPATTLSGGEAQRIRLARELSKKSTGRTLYILDEPTTGLHLEDIRQLVDVLQKLVSMGNTVIVIEHNLDFVKAADYIIDLGPEGGDKGGYLIAEGKPEEISKSEISITGKYLSRELKRAKLQ